jgi:hypothetical protein
VCSVLMISRPLQFIMEALRVLFTNCMFSFSPNVCQLSSHSCKASPHPSFTGLLQPRLLSLHPRCLLLEEVCLMVYISAFTADTRTLSLPLGICNRGTVRPHLRLVRWLVELLCLDLWSRSDASDHWRADGFNVRDVLPELCDSKVAGFRELHRRHLALLCYRAIRKSGTSRS